jgi:hypothetical protein
VAKYLRKALLLAAIGSTLTAFSAAPASAGLLTTGPAAYCDTTAVQPFQRWGDDANYVLTPGGAFESGSPSWYLRGGASVVDGNEPFYVHSTADRRSLLLPAGSSALTPTMCFTLGDWHLRFFLRNRGSSTGRLKVEVLVPSLTGVLTVLDGGTVSAGGTWALSPRVGLLVSNVTCLLGTRAIAFRLRPVGTGASFQVDDVYLDPWKRT